MMRISNNREYCTDVYVHAMRPWMQSYDCKKTSGRFGSYWTITAYGAETRKLLRKCRRHRVRVRCYESRWARSSSYRAEFLKANPEPYVCAYCGKALTRDSLVVDHIVPVAKAKRSYRARRRLRRQGIENVNDVRNLTAACKECNARKSDRMGFWLVRAKHGTQKGFRVFCHVMQGVAAGLIIVAIFLLFKYGGFL